MWVVAFVAGLAIAFSIAGMVSVASLSEEQRERQYGGLIRLIRLTAWLLATALALGGALVVSWIVRAIMTNPRDWAPLLAIGLLVTSMIAFTVMRQRNYYRRYSRLLAARVPSDSVDHELMEAALARSDLFEATRLPRGIRVDSVRETSTSH